MVLELTKLVRDRCRLPRLPVPTAIDDTALGREPAGARLAEPVFRRRGLALAPSDQAPKAATRRARLASAGVPLAAASFTKRSFRDPTRYAIVRAAHMREIA